MKNLPEYIAEQIQINENALLDQIDWDDFEAVEEALLYYLQRIENKIPAFCRNKFGMDASVFEEIYNTMIHYAQDMVNNYKESNDSDKGEKLQKRLITWTKYRDFKNTGDHDFVADMVGEELDMEGSELERYIDRAVKCFDGLVKMATGSYWW